MGAHLYRWAAWYKNSLHALDASWNISHSQSHTSLSEERKSAEFLTALAAANLILYLGFTQLTKAKKKISLNCECEKASDNWVYICLQVSVWIWTFALPRRSLLPARQNGYCLAVNSDNEKSGIPWSLLLIEKREKHQIGGWSGIESDFEKNHKSNIKLEGWNKIILMK